jgi:hypothetical protein
MRSAFLLSVALCATVAAAEESILGLAWRPATTTVASGFDTVMVNPTTGATGTVAAFNVPYMGSVGLSSISYDASMGEIYSVQFSPNGMRGYLTANKAGAGSRIQCRLDIAPVAVHFEGRDANGNPTVVGVAYDNTSLGKQLQVVRFTRMPNAINCKVDSLESTALISTMVSTASAYQNNRYVMFTTQDQSSTVAGTLVTVNTAAGAIRFPLTNKRLSFAVQGIQFASASSEKNLRIFGVTADNKRGMWTVDLENNADSAISSITQATTTTTNVHSMFQFAYLRNKNILNFVTGTNAGSSNLEGFNHAVANQVSLTTIVTLARNNLIATIAIPKATIDRLQGASSSDNTVIVKGAGVYGSSVAQCRFNTGTTATPNYSYGALTQVAGSQDAQCSFPIAPAAGTVVAFDLTTDGVTYTNARSFTYACTVSAVSFVGSSFQAINGLAASRAQAPLEVELRDSASRQCLFGRAGTQVTLSVAANDGSAGIAIGTTTATASTSGLATFPAFAISASKASSADSKFATFTVTASVGSASASIPARIRFYGTTASTLVGTGYTSTGKFARFLINPAVDSSVPVQLHEYAVASTDAVAVGVSAVDRANNVMYTVEYRPNSGTPRLHLRGVAINTNTAASTAGECVIPNAGVITNTLVQNQETVIGFWHKSNTGSATAGSVTFVAIIKAPVTTTTTTTPLRVVEITRTYGQASNSDCSIVEVDSLPVEDIAISAARYYDGYLAWFTNNVEGPNFADRFSTASTVDGSLLSLVKLPVGTKGTDGYQPMQEIARQIELGFSATDLAPMGNGQFVVSGFNPNTAASNKFFTFHVDAMTGRVVQFPDADASQLSVSPFAYTLEHNSDPTDFLLHAYHGDDTTQSLSRSNAQVIGYSSPAKRDYTTTNRLNLIDVQAINEPIATGVTTGTSSVTVTASGIILSSAFRCRFNGGSSVQPTVAAAATAATYPTSVECTGSPSGAISVEISNDGTHYSNAVYFNGGVAPGSSAATTPAVGNPAGVAGLAADVQVVFQFDGKTVADCDATTAALIALAKDAGFTITVSNCQASSSNISGFNRILQTGITSIGIFQAENGKTAAENAAAFKTFATTPAGSAALTNAGVSRIGPVATATTADDDDGLTDGEIAGIVIGSIAGVVLIGALIAFALKGSSKNAPAAAAAPAATYSTRDATFTDATTASASGSYDSTSGSYDSDSGSYDSEDYSDYSGSSYV